jgi:hypothetical protein
VIRAAGDQSGNDSGGPVRGAVAPAQPVTLAAGVRRLPRENDLGGSGLSNALSIGVLGQGSGAVLGGVQAQSATSPSPAQAAIAPSASAAGGSQAVPLASTQRGQALGVPASRSTIR